MKVYLLLLLIATAVTLLVTPVARRMALSFQVLTPLRDRDVHVVPTPRMGGVAMAVGFVITILVGSAIPYLNPVYQSNTIWAVMWGTIAICILGVIDDIWELDWMTKLAGQILVTTVMVINGVQLISFPVFGLTIGSSRLSLLVSVLALVAIINAVNFIDGLDGLAAGVIGIGAVSFFLYSYILVRLIGSPTYATSAALIMIILAGACLGFLWYNFHPASIFMGDSGSMVLGLVMGSAAIIVTGQINPVQLGDQPILTAVLPLVLPLAVLFIPTADLILTAARRLLQGKSPFAADRTHLHHRLLNKGHSHRGVVFIMYAWTLLVCAVAVALLLVKPIWVAVVSVPVLITIIVFTAIQFPGSRQKPDGTLVRGKGVPGGEALYDDGIAVISRPPHALRWRALTEPTTPQEKRVESTNDHP